MCNQMYSNSSIWSLRVTDAASIHFNQEQFISSQWALPIDLSPNSLSDISACKSIMDPANATFNNSRVGFKENSFIKSPPIATNTPKYTDPSIQFKANCTNFSPMVKVRTMNYQNLLFNAAFTQFLEKQGWITSWNIILITF